MASIGGDLSKDAGQRKRLRMAYSIQLRVIRALMIRELSTRFGRENIGFLWLMAEPLMFAVLVGLVWTFLRGYNEHQGISTAGFVASGYIPLTMFRHSVARAIGVFAANASLMYHRQIQIIDFILVRCLVEVIGAMMAFVFIDLVFAGIGLMPLPKRPEFLLAGWAEYCVFAFSLSLVLAPLSEKSEFWEKVIPVTTYIMVPFSGTFTMNSWLTPKAADYLVWSPMVDTMEMIRYGIFGDLVSPIYVWWMPLAWTLPLLALGLTMCRNTRRTLVVQ